MSAIHSNVKRFFGSYLTLLAATPLVELLAGTSLLVTYILFGYRLLLLLIALRYVRTVPGFWRPARQHLILPVLYVVFFLITTIFGVDLEYSIRYRAYFMPTLVVDFFLWYVAGRLFDERHYLSLVYILTGIFGALSISFSFIGLVDSEATRVIYGPDMPIAIAAAVLCSNWVVVLGLMLVALASIKKTVVICAAIAVTTVAGLRWIYGAPGWARDQISPGKAFPAFVVLLLLILYIDTAWPLIEETVGRMLVEREDFYRLAMTEEFFRLLDVYFPWGAGYYTFGFLTSDIIPYTTFTADGTELGDGMSLHNTAMHALLEGGLAVSVVLILLYFRAFRCIYQMFKRKPLRGLAIVLLAWVLVCIAYGMLNQLHATRYYFGVLGYVIGCHWRYFSGVGQTNAIDASRASSLK